MIRRRYAVILAGLCVTLLATAVASASQYRALADEIDEIFRGTNGEISDETYARYAEIQPMAQALYGLITPAVLAALIAAIGMLIVLVLSSRMNLVRRVP